MCSVLIVGDRSSGLMVGAEHHIDVGCVGDLVGTLGADADGLSDRIRESVARGGIDPTMWSGKVSIGMASGPPEDGQLDHLIHEADADMYRRRQSR